MKINDVLNCFNKVIAERENHNSIHFVSHSNWERKMGAVKKVSTIITLCDPLNGNEEYIRSEIISTIINGQEGEFIEETQKKALTEFIRKWQNDTRIK